MEGCYGMNESLPANEVVLYADANVGRGLERLVCCIYCDAVARRDADAPARLLSYDLGGVLCYDLRLCEDVDAIEAWLVARNLGPVTGVFVDLRLPWKVDGHGVVYQLRDRDAYRVARVPLDISRSVVRDRVADYEGVPLDALFYHSDRFGGVPSEPERQGQKGHKNYIYYWPFHAVNSYTLSVTPYCGSTSKCSQLTPPSMRIGQGSRCAMFLMRERASCAVMPWTVKSPALPSTWLER